MKETEQDKNSANLEGFVAVARIVRTRGLRGELVADLLTDFPERFDDLDSVEAFLPDGRRERLEIEEHWFQRDRIVFKFAGYDSIESAKALVGGQLAVPEDERIKLSGGQFYDWELAGCEVESVAGEKLGRVHEVMRTGGVEMLVVGNDSGREFLIPMAEEICVAIDIERKLIRVDPPAGLLEL
jgi:16S rRNA processing protein RimM